jgi:predicted enzyme related to lactoylglutathione lyase
MSKPVIVTEFRLKLYPNDFALVRNFYEERLQFPVVNEWDRGDKDKGVMFNVGGTILELLTPEDGYKPIAGCDLSLEVPDVAELWEQMKNGDNILHPIRDNSWGDTSFRISDPEGYAISFFTRH